MKERASEAIKSWVPNLSSPRDGEPADIAALVVYLASDESLFVNGQLIGIDGGLSAGDNAPRI